MPWICEHPQDQVTYSNLHNTTRFQTRLALAPLAPALLACGASAQMSTSCGAGSRSQEFAKLVKSDEQWRKLLDEDAYEVLFEEDTERPFSSPLNDITEAGTFVCRALLPADLPE